MHEKKKCNTAQKQRYIGVLDKRKHDKKSPILAKYERWCTFLASFASGITKPGHWMYRTAHTVCQTIASLLLGFVWKCTCSHHHMFAA